MYSSLCDFPFVFTRATHAVRRKVLHPIVKPPFWASKANLSFHYTLGGVEIDERTRVLDWDGRPIPKLFAAGEITTGVHGAVRLGTVAILDCLVFGRVAGQTVVKD